ncbi:Rnf8 [Acrasis kona]|uniref:Rnf8 n=1 Tax=Acrasis kona TaxID=1008807 RepID=A0AAW2ZE67_9EUKA
MSEEQTQVPDITSQVETDLPTPQQAVLKTRPVQSSAPKLSLNKAKFDVSYDKIRKRWNIRTTALDNDGTARTNIVERERKDLEWLYDQLYMDHPGIYIPAKELLEPYKEPNQEHLTLLTFLVEVQRNAALNESPSLWDFLTATEQEFERSISESRDDHVKHSKGDIVLNYKKWAPKKFRNPSQEPLIVNFERIQACYRQTIASSKRLVNSEKDIFNSFDVIGREFKVFGNHDKANHNIFHAAGDQFMKLSHIPTTPLNLIPLNQTMDFTMDIYANYIIPSIIRFIDQPIIVFGEVGIINGDIEFNQKRVQLLQQKPTQTPNDQKQIQTINEVIDKLNRDKQAAEERKEVINSIFEEQLKRFQDLLRRDLATGMLNMLHDRLETQNRVIEQLTSQWTYSVLQQQ